MEDPVREKQLCSAIPQFIDLVKQIHLEKPAIIYQKESIP